MSTEQKLSARIASRKTLEKNHEEDPYYYPPVLSKLPSKIFNNIFLGPDELLNFDFFNPCTNLLSLNLFPVFF